MGEMKKQLSDFSSYLLGGITAAISIFALGLVVVVFPSSAEPVGSSEIPKEREIHNTFSDNEGSGTILDATNPMDLINRLRQATAMDNATSPSDAIDDALKALDSQDLEKSSLELTNPSEKLMLRRSL